MTAGTVMRRAAALVAGAVLALSGPAASVAAPEPDLSLEAARYAERLASALDDHLALAEEVAASAEESIRSGGQPAPHVLLSTMAGGGDGSAAVEVAPAGVVSVVAPPVPHAGVVGRDLINDPACRKALVDAIASGAPAVMVERVAERDRLAVRRPVSDASGAWWGFVGVVVDPGVLARAAGVDLMPHDRRLRVRDGATGAVVLASAGTGAEPLAGVTASVPTDAVAWTVELAGVEGRSGTDGRSVVVYGGTAAGIALAIRLAWRFRRIRASRARGDRRRPVADELPQVEDQVVVRHPVTAEALDEHGHL